MKIFLTTLAFLGFTVCSFGQLITFSPNFPTQTDNITLTYDATKGSPGLKDCGCDVYIHTGVITDKSTGPSDWKYVKHSSFNTPFNDVKLTSLGNNKHQIVINNPRTFYGVPSTDKILKISLVFRNADGSKEGKNTDQSDIYLPIYDANVLAVSFTNPALQPKFNPVTETISKQIGDQISVTAVSSKNATITLSLNGNNFANGSAISTLAGNGNITNSGLQEVKVVANDGTTTKEESFTFLVNSAVVTQELPAGVKDGVNIVNNGTSAIFNLYAPNKNNVYVIGDFNNWQGGNASFMKKTPDGNRWWIQIDNLNPNTEYAYQYLVDGNLKVADPYATKVLDPNNDQFINATTYPNLKAYPTGKTSGIVSVFEPNAANYTWQVNNFTRPKKTDLVIYELLVRDFVVTHSYQTLIDTLSYLQNLGVNAIELMPVQEFEGNESWGYNSSFMFAVDKYYGTTNKLKSFIDECHKRGIAVILDMVLNHAFGQSPMVQMYWDAANNRPASNSPWFNAIPTHPFNVGYDFNHESAATKLYSKNVMKYWQTEFKVDGFRFDLSKGFTQTNNLNNVGAWSAYDASRIAIWKDYYNTIKQQDASFFTILEHFADNTEEKELSDFGLMFWGNLNHDYNEAAMGFSSNLSGGVYNNRGWSNPNLITYMESHDEERLMFKTLQFGGANGAYSTKDLNTALKRMEMATAFFLTLPGPKMIWQFGERGYDLSINYPSNTNNDRLSNKPPLWNYMENANRKNLYNVYSKLNKLRIEQPVFEGKNFNYSLNGSIKTIVLQDPALNVVVIGNFNTFTQTNTLNFPSTGKWFDYLTKDSINVTSANYNFNLLPGEYHVYTSRNLNATGLSTSIKDGESVKNSNLFFNYPNPVKDITTFSYFVKQAANVSLKLYDITGREIDSLVDQRESAGLHEIKWDRNKVLINGLQVIIAKLSIGDAVFSHKIILENITD